MTRLLSSPRRVLGILGALVLLAILAPRVPLAGSDVPRRVEVYRSATCGCCIAWARHMERSGFDVRVFDVSDLAGVKRGLGIPPKLAACHTATVDGYLLEGHVPAEDVERLLRERPPVRGLAVPGMPVGSPGMEGPNPERYEVLGFGGPGGQAVFARHGP